MWFHSEINVNAVFCIFCLFFFRLVSCSLKSVWNWAEWQIHILIFIRYSDEITPHNIPIKHGYNLWIQCYWLSDNIPRWTRITKDNMQHIASAQLTVSCKLVIVMITYLSYVLNIYMAKASTYHFWVFFLRWITFSKVICYRTKWWRSI